MKITKTYNWHRRDFSYDAKCENCNKVEKDRSGYDDDNYYNNVIPNWKCKGCGKSSNDIGAHEFIAPKHDPFKVM
jgi:hypothetical protein